MKLRALYLVLFIAIFGGFIISLEMSLLLKISFTLNFLVLFFISLLYLFKLKTFSPSIAIYIVFNYLFFLLAPMFQVHDLIINGRTRFVNTLIFNENHFLLVNFYILIFNIIFYLFFIWFNSKRKKEYTFKYYQKIPIFLFLFLFLVLLDLAANFNYTILETLSSNRSNSDFKVSTFELLFRRKILLFIPFSGFILGVAYLAKSRFKVKNYNNFFIVFFITVLLLVITLFFMNPLNGKRNTLGPLYLTILFLIYPKLFRSNFRMMNGMFLLMIVLFPFIQLFTHMKFTFDEFKSDPQILFRDFSLSTFSETFLGLNYDAFLNFAGTIDYVNEKGFTWGYQLLGLPGFFVPRSLWPGKPETSGTLVAQHLGEKGDWWFTVISNPVVSEGYFNFGIVGVILFAIVLAYFVSLFTNWLNSKDPLKIAVGFYFSIHLMFLLRGSLMNGFGYFVTIFFTIYILPRMLLRLVSVKINRNKSNVI